MNVWDMALLQPLLNVLIALSSFLFNNFGLTIILLTIIIRFILLPLTLRQLEHQEDAGFATTASRVTEEYAKDKQKAAQEQMKLYKESGVNAAGCAIPMLIQFPIWIALYQAIILALAVSPEALLNLSRYMYSWAVPLATLPLNNSFLGLNLASPNAIIAIIVGITMWVQQKMVTPTTQDPRTAQQSQMMLWMMPIIFTFFSLSFPSGLALYWVISNIFSIVVQYFVTGWGSLKFTFRRNPPQAGGGTGRDRKLKRRLEMESNPRKESEEKATTDPAQRERLSDGRSGDNSQDGGGSDEKGSNPLKRWFG